MTLALSVPAVPPLRITAEIGARLVPVTTARPEELAAVNVPAVVPVKAMVPVKSGVLPGG